MSNKYPGEDNMRLAEMAAATVPTLVVTMFIITVLADKIKPLFHAFKLIGGV